MFEAFQIGTWVIWVRPIFLLLAVWLSTEFFLRLAHSSGLSLQLVRDWEKWEALAFLVCGRLMAMLANYQAYVKNPLRVFILWDGGFSFLGGAIGIGIVLFIATRTHRTTFLQWLDALVPATSFGLVFDWLGMFASAQSYGKPTNMPWGITVDTFNVRYAVPIHPVQLYYALFFFALTFALLLIRRYSKRAGAETLWGIIIVGLAVFCLEYMRGDFSIIVFAKITDFLFLLALFASLGVLALIEQRLSEKATSVYAVSVVVVTLAYLIARPFISFVEAQLRFSQVLSILALLATVVYVVVHRRKYPHL